MFKFFHKLLNPHCSECRLDSECKNCSVLRELLEAERHNNKQLLSAILEQHSPKVEERRNISEQIPKMGIPWKVRQQMLEAEDKEKARIMREKTEELEKELGVADAS